MMVAERLSQLRQQRAKEQKQRVSLQDWIPIANPRYMPPKHLKPLTDLIQKAINGEPQRVVVHAPPRFGKTESVLASIVYGLECNPAMTFGFASYNARIALSKSRVARDLAQRMGVKLVKDSLDEWRTEERGGCLAAGIGGGLTGFGLNCAIVDDPLKDRVEAESPHRRQVVHDWFRDVLETRVEPGGSIFVLATRWHPDDLSGRLIREGWPYVCLPALTQAEDGSEVSLWPERWSVADLSEKRERVGPYSWASLFQGSPRPRGGSVFNQPTGYAKLPGQMRVAIGVDLAYTEKTTSDYSALVVMGEWGGLFYVVDVVRAQVRPPGFLEMCKLYRQRFPTARWRWYASGTEAGSASFMRPTIPLEVLPPKGDKFTRSIPLAAGWNAGKVLVPGGTDGEAPPWLEAFLSEVNDFTGVKDPHDDQVDSLAAAYDLLATGGASYQSTKDIAGAGVGRRRY